MSSHWIAAPKAENYPTDFDPRFDRPQPYQSKNKGGDQGVQDWEGVWVLSWWLDDEFQEMKGDARNQDNLCARGALSARDPLLEGFLNLFVADAVGGYSGA